MTLVAAFGPFDVPMIMADVLVSDTTAAGPEIDLPSTASSYQVHPEGSRVSLFIHQKLFVVNDHLAFASAGGVLGAIELRNRLSALAAKGVVTPEALSDFVDHADRYDALNPFVLLLQDTKDRRRTQMMGHIVGHHAWKAARTDCIFTGSGDRAIASGLDDVVPPVIQGPQWFQALSAVNGLVSRLLQQEIQALRGFERLADNPLKRFFGAAYEVAMASEAGISKLSSTFYFWRARIEHNGIALQAPELLLRRAYDGDDLLLRWARPRMPSEQFSMPYDEQICLAVPPLSYRAGAPCEVSRWPAFRCGLECHSVFFENQGEAAPTVMTLTYYDASGDRPDIELRESHESRQTHVWIPRRTRRKLFDALNYAHRVRARANT